MLVRDTFQERDENMKAGIQLAIEFAEPLNDKCALLRNDNGCLDEDDDAKRNDTQYGDKCCQG
jgi:hypothetical protein